MYAPAAYTIPRSTPDLAKFGRLRGAEAFVKIGLVSDRIKRSSRSSARSSRVLCCLCSSGRLLTVWRGILEDSVRALIVRAFSRMSVGSNIVWQYEHQTGVA